MRVNETQDLDKIHAVLRHSAIYPVISDDSCPDDPEKFIAPLEGVRYVLGEDDGEPFAVFIIHPHKEGEKIHIQVLPEHRDQAKEFAAMGLRHTTGKLYADIPLLYPNVIRFAEDFGFRSVDYDDLEYTKNGVRYMSALMEREKWAL